MKYSKMNKRPNNLSLVQQPKQLSPFKKDKRKIIIASNLPGPNQQDQVQTNKTESVYASEAPKEIKEIKIAEPWSQQNSQLYLINADEQARNQTKMPFVKQSGEQLLGQFKDRSAPLKVKQKMMGVPPLPSNHIVGPFP